jgi:hypothetical protein
VAEYGSEPKPKRDTVGLLAGAIFALVGLTYLVGGNHAMGDHWNLVLPGILILLGGMGLATSGIFRGSDHNTPPVERPGDLDG